MDAKRNDLDREWQILLEIALFPLSLMLYFVIFVVFEKYVIGHPLPYGMFGLGLNYTYGVWVVSMVVNSNLGGF